MNQQHAPVFEGLLHYRKQQAFSFHVPGHKDGLIFPRQATAFFKKLLELDATEVAGLDDLYHPSGILREGEALLSNYYRTAASYFLVNGSTVGNLIMVMAACDRGDRIFVQRDCHGSIIHALQIGGLRPVFLAPDIANGLSAGISSALLEKALRHYPDVRSLVLTYPSYYGVAPEIGPLIAEAHRAGLTVLVDEAHGAHFSLGAPVPPDALTLGADLVVQSAHKMLPAMTMGAYLHINSARVSRERVEAVRQIFQTSSPSYPIMASLDLARWYLANLNEADQAAIFAARDRFVGRLRELPAVRVVDPQPGRFRLDPFKIILESSCAASGFELQRRLIGRGIYPELADPDRVLLALGLSAAIDYKRAFALIRDALIGLPPLNRRRGSATFPFPPYTAALHPYAVFAKRGRQEVPIEAAEGKVAAEHVVPYPPGIPAILRGERVTGPQIAAVGQWRHAGGLFGNARANRGRMMIYNGS